MAETDQDYMLRPRWLLPACTLFELAWLGGLNASHFGALRAMVEDCARTYLRMKAQEQATASPKEQRAYYTRLSSGHRPTPTPSDFALYDHVEFLQFCEQSGALSDAQLAPLRAFRLRRGPHPRMSPYILASDLCRVYQWLTGKPVTHSPYKATHYTGAAQSEAGRFVTAAMAAIDPQLPPSVVMTAIRYAADELRPKARRAKGGAQRRGRQPSKGR